MRPFPAVCAKCPRSRNPSFFFCGSDARDIRTPRHRAQRRAKTNEIQRGIANHRLIEVTYLNIDAVIGIGQRAKIAQVLPRTSVAVARVIGEVGAADFEGAAMRR